MTQSASRLYNITDLHVYEQRPSLFGNQGIQVDHYSTGLLPAETFQGFLEHTGTLAYVNRVRLTFRISKPFQIQVGLLKGLLDFNRPKGFLFTLNRADNTISADASSRQQAELVSFLIHIQTLVEKELAFKNHLKRILVFEETYRKAKAQAYDGLVTPGFLA